jgi:hypothetical protein
MTRIHSAPSLKALNFTARLLLRCQISLRAFFYGAKFHSALSPNAPNFFKRLLIWRLICDNVSRQNFPSSPKALNFAARLLLRHLISFRAFSYSAYLHLAFSEDAKENENAQKENRPLKNC